jgi:hypothetical protein
MMFSEEAELNKDRLDAYKLQPLNADYLSLFTQFDDGTALDINALPLEIKKPVSIALDVDGSDLNGEFELSWNAETLPEDWQFILRDNETGEEFDLWEQSVVSFHLSEGKQKISPSGEDKKALNPVHRVKQPNVMKAKAGQTARFTLTINPGQAAGTGQGSHLPGDPKPENYPINTTWPWTDFEAPSPAELGMVGIEAAELTSRHHMNSFFNSFGVRPDEDLDEDSQLLKAGEAGGVVFLDHPGIDAGWWTRRPVEWYVDRFEKHPPEYLAGLSRA